MNFIIHAVIEKISFNSFRFYILIFNFDENQFLKNMFFFETIK